MLLKNNQTYNVQYGLQLFRQNKMLYQKKQYGFRKMYATYMALIDLVDKISCNFDEKNIL